MRRTIVAAAAIASALFAAAVHAKTPDERVAELERQIADMQKTYLANNQDTAAAVSRINSIAEEFNAVRGQAEALSHQLAVQREELMRLIGDLQERLQAMEERMGFFSGQMTGAGGKAAPQAASEAEGYQRALDLYNGTKYLEAAAGFESFLQKYPKSQAAAGARRWIAECFYSSRDYKRAIKEFQNFIERHPKDPKVPGAVLKQGNSFYELGMLDDAKAFFEKVIASYPKAAEAQQAKAKLARIEERKKGGAAGGAPQAPPQSPSHPPSGGAAEAPAGSALGSYPAETIEQQRQKMGGSSPAPAEPAKKPPPPLPRREF